jgi:Uma2 family endonuclease
LTFSQWLQLPEKEGTIYELDEGELLMEPSPTLAHNRIRDRIARQLSAFVQTHQLGEVTVETDFRLGPDTVRNPDVAFIAADHLRRVDPDRSPLEGAPALVVEVVSPGNSDQDMRKKISQYLAAGSRAVWVVYPVTRSIETHHPGRIHKIAAPDTLIETTAFVGLQFSMSLPAIFES